MPIELTQIEVGSETGPISRVVSGSGESLFLQKFRQNTENPASSTYASCITEPHASSTHASCITEPLAKSWKYSQTYLSCMVLKSETVPQFL